MLMDYTEYIVVLLVYELMLIIVFISVITFTDIYMEYINN